MSQIKPITPVEAMMSQRKGFVPPSEVIEAFNDLILRNLSCSGTATIYQDDAIKEIVKKGLTRFQIFPDHSRCLLDIEDAYRKSGWNVVYNKSYREFWTFTRNHNN
jgi:F420-dependent methylenetetrahydromethanopterin dehydrogenase